MRNSNRRVEDLREALRRGDPEYTNRNHTIVITDGAVVADADMCKPCPINLKCFLAGVQENLENILEHGYPCARYRGRILFKYHGTVCLIFDQANRRVTDCNMWGHSVTTSRSIRWYLEALAYNFTFLDLPTSRITEVCKAWKKHRPQRSEDYLWFPV